MKYLNNEKIEKVKLDKNNMYVVIDFDRTITSNESADSWDATGLELGEEFNKKLGDLYKKYRPVELDYTITFKEKNKAMEKWYHECMDLYYEYGLTKEKLEKSIEKSNMLFRKSAIKFLKDMADKDIPVIILSAGIGNVIEKVLRDNNCFFKNMFIISNFIKFDQNGNMEEFEDNIIHTLNKTMKNHLPEEIQKKVDNLEFALLLGDMIEDKKMLDESKLENSILVGFLNDKIEEDLEVYKKNFDIVLTCEDATFERVENLVF